MAGGLSIKVTLGGMAKAILLAQPEKMNEAITKGVENVALLLRDRMTQYSGMGHPEHPNVITGNLRKSFVYEMMETGVHAKAKVGSTIQNPTYPIFVEYGHNIVRGGNVVGYARPYPFVRPAVDDVGVGGEGEKVFTNTVKNYMGI